MEIETIETMNEKEFNSKIEELFSVEEKNKLYFLKNFLKQLEKECEKTNFILKKVFSENKVVIALNSEITEDQLKKG